MYFKVNERRVFAATGGKEFDNSKPVVMFVHGSAMDHTFFALLTRFFAFRNYSVLALDLPGHTFSEGPALTSIERMADWLNDMATTLSIENISVVGHSQGCLNALEFASRYAEKVKSVSFIASGLATPVNPALIESAEKNPEAAIAMMMSWGFGASGHLHQGQTPGNSMLTCGWYVMTGNTPQELAIDLKACDAYKNGEAAAAGIHCPVQVILGGKDRMAPRKAGLGMARALNDPELSIIEQSGHMVPVEAPNQCRQLLRDFIFKNNPSNFGA